MDCEAAGRAHSTYLATWIARPQAEPQRLQGMVEFHRYILCEISSSCFSRRHLTRGILRKKNTLHVRLLTVSPISAATFHIQIFPKRVFAATFHTQVFVRWYSVSKIYLLLFTITFIVRRYAVSNCPCTLFGLGLWPRCPCGLICCMGHIWDRAYLFQILLIA